VQSSRGRSGHLAIKPPRPPVKQCRSPRAEGDYDNTAPTFSFPVRQVRLPPNTDEDQWILTGYPEASARSPSFQRWVPARRPQRSIGTSSSKQLIQPHHALSRRVPDHVYPNTDERVSLQGDMSVCIGLTVQCSPMGVRTSAPSYVTRRHMTPRCGASVIDPAAVVPWRNAHPMRIGPVRSCDDVPYYQSRWRGSEQLDSFGHSVRGVPKFRHNSRNHPTAGPVPAQPSPQRGLGHDFRIPRTSGSPSTTDWKGLQTRGRPSFEDFAVGFENQTSSSVSEDLGGVVQGQPGFLDEAEEIAFDEITQQIASLTETVNELRFKHRRTKFVTQGDDSAYVYSSAVFRGGGTRKQR